MRVLLVNDDGINALGLRALAKRLSREHDVTVVAPETQRSATAHCITLHRPLRVSKAEPAGLEGIPCYTVDGMPVDCVKIGLTHIIPEGADLVISGINHGSNSGSDIIYSGTVSAALDAVIMGYRAFAVSIASAVPKNIETAVEITAALVAGGLAEAAEPDIMYNINVPDAPLKSIKGIRAASQGGVIYKDSVELRRDPRGNEYIWITGSLDDKKDGSDKDVGLLREGYVSVTPIRFDLTARDKLKSLSAFLEKIPFPEGI